MFNANEPPAGLSRRTLLRAGLSGAAALALAGCAPAPRFLSPTSSAVRDVEAARQVTGASTKVALKAVATTVDLAGTPAATWAYGPLPAPTIRLRRGDTLEATLTNELPDPTTIHWHGLALRNDMDGVPTLTQAPVAAGAAFKYRFTAPDPGTYWFHSHVGTQLDRGLYGALIIEDPNEPLAYDEEWVVIVDDWLDGVTTTPPQMLDELSQGMGSMTGMSDGPMRMGNTLMGATSDALDGDAGDVYYPHYLINGRPSGDPETYQSSPGRRVRVRLINAGSDTAFRIALTGHELTVTHTDGFPVSPTTTDAILVGMGERYDFIVTLNDGAFALIAEAEGKQDRAVAIVRTAAGASPPPNGNIPELTRRVLTADQLVAIESAQLADRPVDREITVRLRGGMKQYDWSMDYNTFDLSDPMAKPYSVSSGERVALKFVNTTTMWHPMHLHGHTFQLARGGARKDTSIVLPNRTLTVHFDANNPGRWLTHCHNLYHGEAGMMGVLAYLD